MYVTNVTVYSFGRQEVKKAKSICKQLTKIAPMSQSDTLLLISTETTLLIQLSTFKPDSWAIDRISSQAKELDSAYNTLQAVVNSL